MFKSLKCHSKKTGPMEKVNDVEVEKIHRSIRNVLKDDASLDVEETIGQDKASRKPKNINSGKENEYEALVILERFKKTYNKVEVSDRLRKFVPEDDKSRETLLHTAALFNKDCRVVEVLLEMCPDLITLKRTGSYEGQTALHITIAKEKKQATEAMLKSLKENPRNKNEIFLAKATGSMFKNNIMMGETVLSVAVLTLRTDLVDMLLENGACIDEVNSKGDTVIHTLIKYAEFIPDKTLGVILMLKHLKNKIFQDFMQTNEQKENTKVQSNTKNLIEHMWFKENNNLMTPLKLAVSAGLINIFNAMMKLKYVFYYPSNYEYDGFNDTRYYDITEIDDFTQYEYTNLKEKETSQMGIVCQTWNRLFNYQRPLSIIEILSSLEWKKAQPFVDTSQIKTIISRRWRYHKYPYWIFAFIHVSVMILFTTSIYYRKYVITECKSSKNDCHYAETYAKVTPWVLVLYSAIVIASEVKRLLVLRQIWRPHNHHNNSWYRASLILFASGLFVDAYLYEWYVDSNDIIFIVLILGCWFLFFFLKGFEKFAVYTVLFQKVIMGDLLRFGLIIGIEFTAYSYAMYIVLRGNGTVKEFSTFENTTLTMFSYMLGLKDLSILDNVEAQTQRLVAIIYILFILSTYILLLNSLIAMMSGTSITLLEDRTLLSKLQRSTVIQFLDGVFYLPRRESSLIDEKPNDVFSTNEVTLSWKKFRRNRYYLAIKKDKMGKLVSKKQNKKSLTMKDIKSALFKPNKAQHSLNSEPPSTVVNDNVRELIKSEEPIQSINIDIEKFDEKDSLHSLKSLDIEYQS